MTQPATTTPEAKGQAAPAPIGAPTGPSPQPPRWLERLCEGLFTLAAALILVIVALIVAQIAARNLWNTGLPRAEETARLAGMLSVYLTAPLLALRGQHVAVDVLVAALPRLPRLIAALAAELSMLAFGALTLWGGWLYLQRAWKFRTPALGLQNIWIFAPVMACFGLLCLIALWRIRASLHPGLRAPAAPFAPASGPARADAPQERP